MKVEVRTTFLGDHSPRAFLNMVSERYRPGMAMQAGMIEAVNLGPFSRSVWIDGRLALAVSVTVETQRRGWVVGAPGVALAQGFEFRRLLSEWREFLAKTRMTELRAFVRCEEPAAISFARRAGFGIDCGPCTRLALDGSSVFLMMMERENDGAIWRRRNG